MYNYYYIYKVYNIERDGLAFFNFINWVFQYFLLKWSIYQFGRAAVR